jgi:hypothetical protein
MFATDALRGVNIEFVQVRVVQAGMLDNPTLQLLEAVEDWLKARMIDGESKVLSHEAKTYFGEKLTSRIFDVAYKGVFGRARGRPLIRR